MSLFALSLTPNCVVCSVRAPFCLPRALVATAVVADSDVFRARYHRDVYVRGILARDSEIHVCTASGSDVDLWHGALNVKLIAS